ncbi:MAG: hypothetical protein K0U67_01275 [Actinomycetia bacterium]|nr:hypothetical protein [Actinomycetes bacterium]
MGGSARSGRVGGLAVAFGLGAGIFAVGQGVAAAAPASQGADSSTSNSSSGTRQASASSTRPQRGVPRRAASAPAQTPGRSESGAAAARTPRPARALRRPEIPRIAAQPTPAQTVGAETVPAPRKVAGHVVVELPQMPVSEGLSFTVSPDSVAEVAADYVAGGGDPAESARFFFGDLAVSSLDTLAGPDLTAERARLQLGNLAVSGYFGGIWLRDNLREAPTVTAPVMTDTVDLTVSALGIGLFDVLAGGLMGAATTRSDWIARTAAHASVPVLLGLYGYNRGYLEVLLENPPAGVPSMEDSLSCSGFLGCDSDAFPLEIGTRYDGALDRLDDPPSLGWQEMRLWTAALEGATGAGRGVWEAIAGAGGFSPASYQALVELSSAYLMVSKAAVLSSMLGYAGGDTELARSSLRLQAGLWIWSGAYFAGLASTAPVGTLPTILAG